ncbi:MAG: hypothetical protein MJY64_00815 [archaeon]|nr:hypothetical protein [archaeon]
MRRKIFSAIIATAVASILILSSVSPDLQDEKYVLSTSSDTNDSDEFYKLSCQVYEVWGPLIICLGAVMFGAIIAGVAISKEDDEKRGMCQ